MLNVLKSVPNWYALPFFLLVFLLPVLAVTVDSGATSIFWLLAIPSIILCWRPKIQLHNLEKKLLYGTALFTLIMGLSLINAEDFSESLGSYERYIRFLLFVPIYIFVRKYRYYLAPITAWGLIIGCLAMGLVAIYQFYILDIPQPMGARQINRFGFTAVTIFFLLVVHILFYWRNKWVLLLACIASLIIIYGIALNNTRGAMLSVFPFIILLAFAYKDAFTRKKVFLFLLATAVLIAAFIHPSSPVGQYFHAGFDELSLFIQDPLNNYQGNWGIRPLLMYHGLLIYLESPILGTGLGDYDNDLLVLMESGKLVVNDPAVLMGAHNIYIHILAETGTIGFLAFMAFVFFMPTYIYTKYFLKYRDNPAIFVCALSGLTLMICHFIFGMSNTWLTNNSISIFLILNLVYLTSIFTLADKEKGQN